MIDVSVVTARPCQASSFVFVLTVSLLSGYSRMFQAHPNFFFLYTMLAKEVFPNVFFMTQNFS